MNPFTILKTKPGNSKAEILKQVSMRLAEKEYDAKTIAEAQKILFNPVTKITAEFQYYLNTDFMHQISEQTDIDHTAIKQINHLKFTT